MIYIAAQNSQAATKPATPTLMLVGNGSVLSGLPSPAWAEGTVLCWFVFVFVCYHKIANYLNI